MIRPIKVSKGDDVLAEHHNQLVDAILERTPLSIVGGRLSTSPAGWSAAVDPPPPKQRRAETVAPQPFQLKVTTDPADTSENPPPKIRVYASTLAGGSSTDLGFAEGDDPWYLLTPSEGVVQGGITIDADGLVTSRWIEIVSEMTADTDDTFYVEIGTVSQDSESGAWLVSNSSYGPISAMICRNWYAAEAPFYGVSFA